MVAAALLVTSRFHHNHHLVLPQEHLPTSNRSGNGKHFPAEPWPSCATTAWTPSQLRRQAFDSCGSASNIVAFRLDRARAILTWLNAVLCSGLPIMAHPEPLATDQHHKRKRDSDDNGQQSHDRIPQPPPPQSGNGAHINYLARSNSARLKLIQGDGEVFSDVLGLIGDYEGVLSRHESLAANLGAKLTGPRLVKAMEGLFEGSITATRRDPYNSDTVTWLDIVQFAKASPNDFTLTSNPDRGRYCSFYLKGNQVEITEDDWRLIMSGTLDRFNLAPLQPLEEDENSELATLEIMEQRLQVLIKKADEVARKARQLNYHLSGRKAAINSRRTVRSPTTHHAGFQPVNHQQAVPRSNSTYDLHADLLQQFTSQSQPGSARIPAQNSISLPTTPVIQVSNHVAPFTLPSSGG